MLIAFIKGIYQLNDRATWNVLLISIITAIAVFVLLWFAIGYFVIEQVLVRISWLDTLIDVLGGLATLALTWFLFPSVVSSVIGLFLERIAVAVEARHYPNLPEVVAPTATTAVSIKFLVMMMAINLFVMIFLLVPPVFPFVFYAVNGYLLSREYFELVASRRAGADEIRELRKAHRGRLFVAGMIVALLLTIPGVNLLAPIVGHAGDGNFHLGFLLEPGNEVELARAKRVNDNMIDRALAMGGTCTGEHGIGVGKIGYMEAEHGNSVDVMRMIKRSMDPQNLMNPGKVLAL